MLKIQSIDYIFGMITGASLRWHFGRTSNVTASSGDVQQVEVVNTSWSNPVPVQIVD